MRIRTLTVTELNNYLKRIIINDPILNNVVVKGEISNFKLHNSGHAYFSVKDENSKIKCVMFNSEFYNLGFIPQDGMKVIVKGYISIYEKNGEYQLYANEISRDGLGELYVAFEKLKKKLEKEGYFDINRKRKIPAFPQKIGVVTSPTGAAVKDVISVLTRRNRHVDIVIYPVLVQGERAAGQIAEGIDVLNSIKDIDLIIITRGGGSIEELWPFNEEIVAKSIFSSNKPIISAVGHETDFTIADFVADLRAPTPSAAAEIAVPYIEEIKRTLLYLHDNLRINILGQINNFRNLLKGYDEDRIRQYLLYKVNEEKLSLDYIYSKMGNRINNIVDVLKKELSSLGENLNNLSPLSTISRGYSIVLNEEKDKTITDIEEIKEDEIINILLRNGLLKCKVEKIEKGVNMIDRKYE